MPRTAESRQRAAVKALETAKVSARYRWGARRHRVLSEEVARAARGKLYDAVDWEHPDTRELLRLARELRADIAVPLLLSALGHRWLAVAKLDKPEVDSVLAASSAGYSRLPRQPRRGPARGDSQLTVE